MAFDVDKLFEFSVAEIRNFAATHQDEIFYAFAIDASLLCLNSEEQADKTLQNERDRWERSARHLQCWDELTEIDLGEVEFILSLAARYSGLDRTDKNACVIAINASRAEIRKKGDPHRRQEEIDLLRENTGDWAYQGFATMRDHDGFDRAAYDIHYNLDDHEQLSSEYGLAMDALVARLRESDVFDCLKRSADFKALRVEHSY